MNKATTTPSETNTTPSEINVEAESTSRFMFFSHEFPSGDVKDLIRRLSRHAKLPRYSQLARFLQECASVLRQEVQKLPRPLRDQVPPFSDIITLASHWERLKQSDLCGTWEGAFLCIYEIAMLIGHHEAHDLPYALGTRNTSTTCLAGISVGLFSAAAVAVSSSLVDLVYYGVESVRIAFSFCVHVGRVSQLLEPTERTKTASSVSWAYVVIGISAEVVQAELDRFNGQDEPTDTCSKTSRLAQVSISHVDQASVGVTGPPAQLEQLFRQSEVLGSSRHSPLPISGGLCHVPNVYDLDDVRSILETAEVWERWGSRPVQLPLLSPNPGAPFSASDAYHLIEAICTEALTKPLYFDNIAEGAALQLSRQQELTPLSCQILHYRTSLISDTILSDVAKKLSAASLSRQDLVDWAMQDEDTSVQPHGNSSLPQNSKLAIVGMSCRMPGGADSPEQFWELLMNGVDTLTIVPADRFDVDAHFDPSGEMENDVGTKFGNFIHNPGHFDAGFFNMSPREAEQTDPMQRLALVTAYEALEMAGFVPNRTPSSHVSRVGTYYGQASDDYREVNASQKIGTYGIPGTERAFGNGRINYFFNFQGPSINVDTACSSGLAAVHAACSALWAGDADTVVAGGLNVITNPDIYCMLSKGHFLSKTGQCKVWDSGADGYCRADGIGSVVIKRLDDAIADNDNILATIVSGSTNQSAESISITQPHAGAQKDNYRQVMDKAGINPLDVSYVELHGTGTQVGDAVESESVLDFFAPLGSRQRSEQRLSLGAVKSNIGHGEAAAGIASLMKVLLMYKHGMIPRHIGIKKTMNPVVAQHLANRNAGILTENRSWLPKPDGKKRYSIVNSFGAHGGNTTLLLEDAPLSRTQREADDVLPDTTACQVICISAKSKASLRGNISALLRHLDSHPETELRDLSYTTCARRIHHHIRIATSVSSTAQLRKFLEAASENVDNYAKHVSAAKKKTVVFAFSGQGCFYQGAAAQLFQQAPSFRDQVLQLDRVVRQLGFPSVLAAIIGDSASSTTSQSCSSAASEVGDENAASTDGTSSVSSTVTVESPLVIQLSMVVMQIALVQYWGLLGIKPDVVIGHSLGEYAAFVAAGVLSVADAIYLVGRRAKLMLAACEPGSHGMLSVRGASVDRIAELCKESGKDYRYEVSCINGVTDIVVSGLRADIVALQDMLQGDGLKCVLLDIPFAFHSAQLEPILEDYEDAARHATFKAPAIPVVSPLLGQCVSQGEMINETYLRRATREPVDFIKALEAVRVDGLVNDNAVWVDIGPHPVCTSFARNHYEKGTTQTFASLRQGDNTLSTLTGTLASLHCLGLPVAWNEYFAAYEKSLRLVHLEPYQWNQKNYWIQYEGTWTLDKAHAGQAKNVKQKESASPPFFTSSAQQIISQESNESIGRMTVLSNLSHPDLAGAANGHKINGRSVVTGSLWADLALTIGEYLYKHMVPEGDEPYMDVQNMEVLEGQVLHDKTSSEPTAEQFIQAEGVLDLSKRQTHITLYTASADGTRKTEKPFASATVCYEDVQTWRAEWLTASHLVATRADSLWKAAAGEETSNTTSRVSRLSQGTVYQLFANVVDYGKRYRGMKSVALAEATQEATADITLDIDRHGTWHTPPHWIDSTFQLAGFVMNAFGVQGTGEYAGSSRDFFWITPGWRHFRLAEKLEPGVAYRNYVRMFPVPGELGAFSGDIYLLRGDKVVGVCAGIKFKRVPRSLMPIMFPSGQSGKSRAHVPVPAHTSHNVTSKEPVKPKQPKSSSAFSHAQEQQSDVARQVAEPVATTPPAGQQKPKDGGQNPKVAACLQLIAEETGLELEDLSGDAAFAELGVDSLMSLALSGKMRAELGIEVQASIFLECATVQELANWLGK